MSEVAQSAGERAYAAIRAGILDGLYPAGAMLGEVAMAAEIGVSRTPVRAALSRLQEEGWLTIYPNRGAVVRELNDRAIADLADARLVLEAAGVALAPAPTRARLATILEESLKDQRAAMAERDVRAFIESTITFHRSFVEVAGNDVLLELNDRLADRQRFLLSSSGDELLARCSEIIREHEDLVRQLAEGSADAFADTLRAHLRA
ncbi:GntR family transcriptional regulator [Pseudoclavibacter sp. RFBG4]|uniref:GntR family transcriptional regulator n=1 Tax=Pseudoclavibacter sp. RFBG4 TaxID=2080575 RepID=UPI001C66EB4A|nr:GntR family transcriptional regulator [Pseudoclavibacter sp. RFBG4]